LLCLLGAVSYFNRCLKQSNYKALSLITYTLTRFNK
jgi:hypothetical protein